MTIGNLVILFFGIIYLIWSCFSIKTIVKDRWVDNLSTVIWAYISTLIWGGFFNYDVGIILEL